MKLVVNGVELEGSGTLLDVCRAHGIEVPTACFDERLERGGHCRACMVEAGGRMEPACTTPAREGWTVVTDSEALRLYRRDLGELMLSESAPRGRVGAHLE